MSSENEPSRINRLGEISNLKLEILGSFYDHDLTCGLMGSLIRCLEEGAEEFFLKPVQLSDVNKLRPHMLKGRAMEDQPNINKRKVMEQTQTPERTRTKYNDLEVTS